jgi:hypothetical protein
LLEPQGELVHPPQAGDDVLPADASASDASMPDAPAPDPAADPADLPTALPTDANA